MIIGFHYHVPAVQKDDGIYMPGYVATFIDGLAATSTKIVCYLHSPLQSELDQMDYKLKSANIELVNIGPHINVFKRVFKQKQFIQFIEKDIIKRGIDLMLIRAPSPLSPFVTKICIKHDIKYSYLIVGDYVKNLKESKNIAPLKRILLNIFYNYNKYYQDKYAKDALLFTNNPIIYEEYKHLNMHEIRTTTLSENDFFYNESFYENKKLNILYAGRIEPSKGIEDIIEALLILKERKINILFNLVGWDVSKNESHLVFLKNKIIDLGLEKNFIFHGKKQVGIELFKMYRDFDVYISATIVIATNAGSIPKILTNDKNAILIDKNSPKIIAKNIIKLLDNEELVDKLRKNAYSLAKTNTIEKQSKIMIGIIKEYIE